MDEKQFDKDLQKKLEAELKIKEGIAQVESKNAIVVVDLDSIENILQILEDGERDEITESMIEAFEKGEYMGRE